MCSHDNSTEKSVRITAPRAVRFESRYSVCESCGHEFATPAQRKKNRKRYNYACNVYARSQRDEIFTSHGIYST